MVRFYIVVSETRNGVRSKFNFNRQPIKPGTVGREFRQAVDDQYAHLSESGLPVRGYDHNTGNPLDRSVMMWVVGDGYRRGVSITVRRAGG